MQKEKIQIISLSAAPRFLDYNSTQTKNLQTQAEKIEKYILINFQKTKYKVTKVDNILFLNIPRLKSIFYIKKIIKTIREYLDPKIKTVITTGNPFDLGILGIIFKAILKFPLQSQIHTDLYSKYFLKSKKRHYIYFFISKIVFLFSNSIRTVSKNTEKILRKKYPKKLIKNIIEVADFSDIQITSTKNKEGVFYLCPSRYDNGKNLENLILSFIDFHKVFSDTKIKIIGYGILKDQLDNLIKINNAEEYIDLAGWSNNMPNEYTQTNFTILASVFEGYSMVVVESMHYGTPFLATPFSGSTELIQEDINGYISKGFSKEDIYELLVKSYKNNFIFNSETIKETVKDLTKDNMDKELIKFWKETL